MSQLYSFQFSKFNQIGNRAKKILQGTNQAWLLNSCLLSVIKNGYFLHLPPVQLNIIHRANTSFINSRFCCKSTKFMLISSPLFENPTWRKLGIFYFQPIIFSILSARFNKVLFSKCNSKSVPFLSFFWWMGRINKY